MANKMRTHFFSDQLFHQLDVDGQKRRWTVVEGISSEAFFKYRGNVGYFPNVWFEPALNYPDYLNETYVLLYFGINLVAEKSSLKLK